LPDYLRTRGCGNDDDQDDKDELADSHAHHFLHMYEDQHGCQPVGS
jgi:hypothetical protein